MTVIKSNTNRATKVASFPISTSLQVPEIENVTSKEPSLTATEQITGLLAGLNRAERNELFANNFTNEIKEIINAEVKSQLNEAQTIKNADIMQIKEKLVNEFAEKELSLMNEFEKSIRGFTDKAPIISIVDKDILYEVICKTVSRIVCNEWNDESLINCLLTDELDKYLLAEKPVIFFSANTLEKIKKMDVMNDIKLKYDIKTNEHIQNDEFQIELKQGKVNSSLKQRLSRFVDMITTQQSETK